MYLLWMTASLTGSSSRGSSRPHHPAKVTTTLLDRVERRGWDLKACVGASVTTVDSGSKALQMLGLREDEESTSPVPADKNVRSIDDPLIVCGMDFLILMRFRWWFWL